MKTVGAYFSINSLGKFPDLETAGTVSRSGTIVPNQVTNLDVCSLVSLLKVWGRFFFCFLKVNDIG